jgi:hypothetical protein
MTPANFSRRPGFACEVCGVKSPHVAEVIYESGGLQGGTVWRLFLVLCAPCAERAARVARGHEPGGPS